MRMDDRMADPRVASRPQKYSHLDTIHYEIDMLHYCYEQLRRDSWPDQSSFNLCLEGFLLHYRNLCEFFASAKALKANQPEVWCPNRNLSPEEGASVQNTELDEVHNSPISRYLSHCSEIRAERDRTWTYGEMFDAMKPCMDSFRNLFPVKKIPNKEILIMGAVNLTTSNLSYPVFLTEWLSPEPKKAPEE
jgi:hypothetical protein